MINNKRILAITLARGGSKAIPSKNIMLLQGKPLIEYTITEVLKSQYVDNYIVSTDSQEIANVSESLGAEIPFMRPAEFSTDESPPQDGLYHGLTTYEEKVGVKFDYVVEIMCTNPLKRDYDIDACIEKLDATGADAVISVARLLDHHPARIKKIVDDQLVDFAVKEDETMRRQDLRPEAYIRNGSIYAFTRDTLLVHKSKIGNDTRPYIMPDERSVNIDEPHDIPVAEYLLEKLLSSNK